MDTSSTDPSPQSFSFYLLSGEALVYRSTTVTPPGPAPGAYLVQGTLEALTTDVVKTWFIQSIAPLVGSKAAEVLEHILDDERADEFLKLALYFRQNEVT